MNQFSTYIHFVPCLQNSLPFFWLKTLYFCLSLCQPHILCILTCLHSQSPFPIHTSCINNNRSEKMRIIKFTMDVNIMNGWKNGKQSLAIVPLRRPLVTFLRFLSVKWLCPWTELKSKPLIKAKLKIMLDSAVIKVWSNTKETYQNIPATEIQSSISTGWRYVYCERIFFKIQR